MPDFVLPKIDTKTLGVPAFEYAFQVFAKLDTPHATKTTRGGRLFQSIAGGEVKGPRLTGTVYPYSGGDFSFIEKDGVQELNARYMMRAADTNEWIYVEHRGYKRPGYYRIQASFDADKQGKYTSLNGGIFLAIAEEVPGKNEVTFTYYEVV